MLRDNLEGLIEPIAAREPRLSRYAPVSCNRHRTIDPHALKIPAPKGRNLPQRRTSLLHFTLSQDSCGGSFFRVLHKSDSFIPARFLTPFSSSG